MTLHFTPETCSSVFVTALFTIVRHQKQTTSPSADEQIMKILCIYTMEYYSSVK